MDSEIFARNSSARSQRTESNIKLQNQLKNVDPILENKTKPLRMEWNEMECIKVNRHFHRQNQTICIRLLTIK